MEWWSVGVWGSSTNGFYITPTLHPSVPPPLRPPVLARRAVRRGGERRGQASPCVRQAALVRGRGGLGSSGGGYPLLSARRGACGRVPRDQGGQGRGGAGCDDPPHRLRHRAPFP